MKGHLLTCCLLLWGISLTAKAYQNPVSGTWKPPASLLPFWMGIDPKWWSEPGRKDLVEYCEHYAKTHKPQLLLDDIIEDQKLNPEVTRTFVYSWVVTSWSDPIVMKELKRLCRDGTRKEKSIAADFIAPIESHPHELVPLGESIDSPDKMYSFKIEYYDREYHFKLKRLASGKITSLDFEQGPVLAVRWTSDSESIFIAAHYARGKLLDVIHYDGKNWQLNEIVPPEDNIGEYEILNWRFHKHGVQLFFKFFILDEKYHPTYAYKCSLGYNPSTAAMSDYKKEAISFDAYGRTKSELAPN